MQIIENIYSLFGSFLVLVIKKGYVTIFPKDFVKVNIKLIFF